MAKFSEPIGGKLQLHVDAREFRARTYLPNGQQFDSWLPPAAYAIGGVVGLRSGRDNAEWIDARELLSLDKRDKGQKWYIGEAVFRGIAASNHVTV